MAGISFSIDDADIRAADRWLAATTGQLDFVTSLAIGATVKSIHGNLRRQLPSAIDRPTNWTRRGLLVRYPTRTDLSAAVGFNYGDGSFEEAGRQSSMGTPSGRYMDVQARGGSRTPKASEQALRRAYLSGFNAQGARPDEFLVPGGYGIGKPDAAGNISGAKYMLMLSRLRANRDIGTTSNAPEGPGSRGRTAAKRRDVDVFISRRRGGAAIMQRTGRGPKGGTGIGTGKPGRPQTVGFKRDIKAAFYLVRNPRYQVRFPVRQLAMDQFRREIGPNFTAALEWAQRNPKR